jgi:uncharacterized damage-inducible protein DinB
MSSTSMPTSTSPTLCSNRLAEVGPMNFRGALDPAFRLVWGTVRKNVEAMPERDLWFRPEGLETRSFREIALHMANASAVFGDNVGRPVWERFAAFPPDKHTSRAEVLDALAQGGDRFLAGLARVTDEEAARVVQTPWGAEMSQGQLVAGHVPHMFYHNGQLTIYLRMRGIKPLFLAR